jgi:hypothetical protein
VIEKSAMNKERARWAIIILMAICIICALVATFVEQDLLFSLISISGYFTFKFAFDNPKMLLASSWREFGEVVDQSENKAQLIGSKWYFISVLLSAAYILII